MLLEEFYKKLKVEFNMDGTDDYFGIDDFNDAIRNELRSFVIDVVNEEKDNSYEKNIMSDYLLDSLSNTDGIEALPSDYLESYAAVWVPTSGPTEPIDIITKSEFLYRKANTLAPPLGVNRICYVDNGSVYFFPSFSSGGTAYLYFVRDPVIDTINSEAPFLDYYMDANDELTFLNEGESLSGKSGKYRSGADMSGLSTTCATYELDIPVYYHMRYYKRLLERLTVKYRDQLVMQQVMTEEQQDKTNN